MLKYHWKLALTRMFVRPYLEYHSQAVNPFPKTHECSLERTERRNQSYSFFFFLHVIREKMKMFELPGVV